MSAENAITKDGAKSLKVIAKALPKMSEYAKGYFLGAAETWAEFEKMKKDKQTKPKAG